MDCLLLDLGNSRMKSALLGPKGPVDVQAHAYPRAEDRVQAVAAHVRARAPRRVVVCSVLGSEMDGALAAALEVPVRLVHSGEAEAFGVRLAYPDPDTLGTDRAVALVAARARVGGPCIVVDCGTAVTVDALDAGGRHLGGVILPGVHAMAAGLRCATRGVRAPTDLPVQAPPVFARGTAAAVRAGLHRALVAGIEAVVADMAASMDGPVRVIASGGDAAWLARASRLSMDVVAALTLEGLAIMERA